MRGPARVLYSTTPRLAAAAAIAAAAAVAAAVAVAAAAAAAAVAAVAVRLVGEAAALTRPQPASTA